MTGGDKLALMRILREIWESGAVWFWRCLTSVDAIFYLVEDHVSPRCCLVSRKVEEVLSEYWCQESAADNYEKELGSLFRETT